MATLPCHAGGLVCISESVKLPAASLSLGRGGKPTTSGTCLAEMRRFGVNRARAAGAAAGGSREGLQQVSKGQHDDGIQQKASIHQTALSRQLPRREALLSVVGGVVGAMLTSAMSSASAQETGDSKTRNLSIEEVKDIIAKDIGDRQYFVTGNLTKSIYRDDCRFVDPTNDTAGLARYLAAVDILFDPASSQQQLLSIQVTGPNTILASWTLGGYLKFPWNPRVLPFEGTTEYSLDADNLVAIHREKWTISPATALLETLTPTFGPKQLL